MRILPLGVGDAFTARYYSTCVAVQAEGRWLLIDCPHPIRKMMAESPVTIDVADIDAVALTHLHGDHVSGLEGFAFFKHFVLRQRCRLLAHPEVAGPLWDRHLAVAMEHLIDAEGAPKPALRFEDYFEHTPLSEQVAVQVGPFRIECRRTIHHVPTYAMRIHAGGVILGHSADTAFDPTLIDWLAEADLIIHETNYGAHTPYASLAALPERLRHKMRLIHYPDDFDVDASLIAPMRQGQICEIRARALM